MPYSHPDWPMKRCLSCELIYLEYVPTFARLFDELAWTEQRKRQWERRIKEQPILARLDKWTLWRLGLFGDPSPAGGLRAWAEPGAVLDVGCSTGKAFARLDPRYTPHGIEIEARAAAEAHKEFERRGGRVVNADGVTGLAQFPSGYFTGISLWSYLEHEARPKEALVGVRRVLRARGIVLVKVPNFDCWNRSVLGSKWPGFRHPDHVQYFTPKTLTHLAQACGFRATFRLYGRIPTNDNMFAILRPA
jgi:SAM-dependent methyltransferase